MPRKHLPLLYLPATKQTVKMLARSALRLTQRAVRPAAFAPLTSRAAFNSSSKSNDPEVPVISYHRGERKEEAIQYEAQKSGPVTPPGADAEKAAIPLKPDVLSKLTPTLQRFTLPGKVAVVTG